MTRRNETGPAHLCGWCASAARSTAPAAAHKRCHGPCACGEANHQPNVTLVECCAAATKLAPKEVWARWDA